MFVRIFILVAVAVLVWSATAHSSQAHGRKQVVTVKPYDTLWAIAQRRCAGDPRAAIWRSEQANHRPGADVSVGQQLVLP
jgi:hypothetical protein